MKKNGFVVRVVSVVVATAFLWTNCVWAGGVSYLAVDSQVFLEDVFRGYTVLRTPMALHSALIGEGITELRALSDELDRIKKLLVERGEVKRGDIEKYYAMVFKDDSERKAYYYFNTDGYFFRITPLEGVMDDFYVAFLKSVKGLKEPVPINGYMVESYKIDSKETKEVINTCIGNLYGVSKDEVKTLKKMGECNVFLEEVKRILGDAGDGVSLDNIVRTVHKDNLLPVLKKYIEDFDRDNNYSIHNIPYSELEVWDVKAFVLALEIFYERVIPMIRESDLSQDEKEELINILEFLANNSFSYMLMGKNENPVHYNFSVLHTMLRIGLGEGLGYRELRNALVLALLHDIGNAEATLGKVKKEDLKKAEKAVKEAQTEEEKQEAIEGMKKLLQMAIAARDEHMVKGAPIVRNLLKDMNKHYGREIFTDEDINSISDVVRIHDNPSKAEYLKKYGHYIGQGMSRDDLIPLDNRLAVLLREADRLWMITREGVEKDLIDELKKEKKHKSPMEQLKGNAKRFREEVDLYRGIYSDEVINGFRGGTLFRSESGYNIYLEEYNKRRDGFLIKTREYFVVEKDTGRIVERLSTSGKRVLRASGLSDSDIMRGIKEGRFEVKTREEVLAGLKREKCGIGITGGGDCAGIADFLSSFKKYLDPKFTMLGVRNAGKGLMVPPDEFNKQLILVDGLAAEDFVGQSSTPFGSSREDPLKKAKENTVANIKGYGFFYATGGNDHLGILEGITREFPDMIVVGTFKSIDGDGCVAGRPAQMLGFRSAVEVYRKAIWSAAQNAKTHGEMHVIETFGRNAGKLAFESARRYPPDFDKLPKEEQRKIIECRDIIMILVPEKPTTLRSIVNRANEIKKREGSCVVVVAEGFMSIEMQMEMSRLAKDDGLKKRWLEGKLGIEEIPGLIQYTGDDDPRKDLFAILKDRELAALFAKTVWETKLDAHGNVTKLAGIRKFVIQALYKLGGAKKVNELIENYEARGASPCEYDTVMGEKVGRKMAELVNQGVTGGKAVVYFEGMDAMTEEPVVVDLVGVSDKNNLNNPELYPDDRLQENGVFLGEPKSGVSKLHLFPKSLYFRYIEKGLKDPEHKIEKLFDKGIARYDTRRKMTVINREGLESMKGVLTGVLDRAVSILDVERVLRWHEKFEEFIGDNRISFDKLINELIRQFGQSELKRLFDGFCNNYNYPRGWRDEDLVREVLVHTLVERLFFKQSVRLLYSKKDREDGFYKEYIARDEEGVERRYYAYNLDDRVEKILIRFAKENGIDTLYRVAKTENGIKIVSPDEDREFAKVCADMFVAAAVRAIQEKGRFVAALPLGQTPIRMYRLLATDGYKNLIDWRKVYIFVADERVVSKESRNSNYKVIEEELIEKLLIPRENFHYIDGGAVDKSDEAKRYAGELRRFIGKDGFDLVLLSMGKDGHVAGIYPGSTVLRQDVGEDVVYDSEKNRFTLAKSPILGAKRIILLVSGKKKAEPLKEMLTGSEDTLNKPARILYETVGELTIVADSSALEKIVVLPLRAKPKETEGVIVKTGWLFDPALREGKFIPEEEEEVNAKMERIRGDYKVELAGVGDKTARAKILNRMRGWVYSDMDWANPMVKETIQLAERIRNDFEAFVHVGIGGSDQTTKAIVNATVSTQHNLLSKDRRGGAPQIYYTGDTFDSNSIIDILTALESQGILFKTVFNIVSKSGTTAETVHTFLVIRSYLELRLQELSGRFKKGEIDEKYLEGLGLKKEDLEEAQLTYSGKTMPYYRTGRQFVFVTGLNEKSALYQYAGMIESAGDKVFGLLPVPDGTGGRFSFATPVGLLAMGVTANSNKGEMPEDRIKQVLRAVKDVRREVMSGTIEGDTIPAFAIARANYIAGEKKKKNTLVIYPYANKLQEFANLMMQLLTESNQEGGKGLNVLPLVGPARNHSVVNGMIGGPRDKVVCFIKVMDLEDVEISRIKGAELIGEELVDLEGLKQSDVQSASYEGTIRNLVDNGVPCYEIHIPRLTPYWVSRLMVIMEHAVAIEGELLEVGARYEKGEYVSMTYLQDNVEGYKEETRGILKRLKASMVSVTPEVISRGTIIEKPGTKMPSLPDEFRPVDDLAELICQVGLRYDPEGFGYIAFDEDDDGDIKRAPRFGAPMSEVLGLIDKFIKRHYGPNPSEFKDPVIISGIGIGGQTTCAVPALGFLVKYKDRQLYVCDSLGTNYKELEEAWLNALRGNPNTKLLWVVGSKSGSTDETMVNFQMNLKTMVRIWARYKYGDIQGKDIADRIIKKFFDNKPLFEKNLNDLGLSEEEEDVLQIVFKNLVIVTGSIGSGSRLAKLVEKSFLNDLYDRDEDKVVSFLMLGNLGGRFQGLSPNSFIYNALLGLDVRKMLESAREIADIQRKEPLHESKRVATELWLNKIRHLIIAMPNDLIFGRLSEALGQMIPESTGKGRRRGVGLGIQTYAYDADVLDEVFMDIQPDKKAYLVIDVKGEEPVKIGEDIERDNIIIRYTLESISEDELARLIQFVENITVKFGILNSAQALIDAQGKDSALGVINLTDPVSIKKIMQGPKEGDRNYDALMRLHEIFNDITPFRQPDVEFAKKLVSGKEGEVGAGVKKFNSSNRIGRDGLPVRDDAERVSEYNKNNRIVEKGPSLNLDTLGLRDSTGRFLTGDEAMAVLSNITAGMAHPGRASANPGNIDEIIKILKELGNLQRTILASGLPIDTYQYMLGLKQKRNELFKQIQGLASKADLDTAGEETARQLAGLLLKAHRSGKSLNFVLYEDRNLFTEMLKRFVEFLGADRFDFGTAEQHKSFQLTSAGVDVSIEVLMQSIKGLNKVIHVEEPIVYDGCVPKYLHGLYPSEVSEVYLSAYSDRFRADEVQNESVVLMTKDAAELENIARLMALFVRMMEIYSANKSGQKSPIGKRVKEGRRIYREFYEIGVKDARLTDECRIIGERGPKEEEKDILKRVLDKLIAEYGPGILTLADGIRVVDNISVSPLARSPVDQLTRWPVSPYGMMIKEDGRNILLLDVDAFSNEELLYIDLEHELKEGIMGIVPCENDVVRELTTNFMSLKLALEKGIRIAPSPFPLPTGERSKERGRIDKAELEKLGADLQFFEALEVLQAMKEVSDNDIIAVAIEHMRGMPYYAELFREFSFAREWEGRIKDAENRYQAALRVFNEIMEAKVGLEKTVDEVNINIKVVNTFTGKMRVLGLEELSRRLQEMVGVMAKLVHSKDRLAGQVARQDETKYILVDENRLKEMNEEGYARVVRELSNNNYQVVIELPQGVDLRNVIRLVDPSDLEDMPRIEGISYLPMPYIRSSFYIAAHIVGVGGDFGRIDPLVKELIKGLYKGLNDDELGLLFKEPWRILPKIQSVIGDLDNLRKAIEQIEKAA